jgi:hypothetical protein
MHLIKTFRGYLSSMILILGQLWKKSKASEFDKLQEILKRVLHKSDAQSLLDLFTRRNCFDNLTKYLYRDIIDLDRLWAAENQLPKQYLGEVSYPDRSK